MGQYHYLLNITKREFINPNDIGNGLKLHEQIGWPYATATALVMLLAASSKDGGRGGGDFCADHPLIGSWAGDRIAFVGDYSEPDDIPLANAERMYEECERVVKGRQEGRRKWTNISAQVREMMSLEFGIRYAGEGWLQIVEGKNGRVSPRLAPDVVKTAKA